MLKYFLLAVAIAAAPAIAEVNIDVKIEPGKVFGDLKTPEYPTIFTNSKPIVWKFESEPDTTIQIKCIDFRLTQTDDCKSIRLEVVSGDHTQSYCGHYDALKILSSTNVITLKLEGDEYGQGVFSCYAKSTKLPEAEEVAVKLNEIVTIGSPVSTGEEPVPHFDKVWHLKAEEGYQVDLNCYVNLLEVSPCHDDVLTIDLGNGPQEYCGFKNELVFSKSNEATVRLELDKDGNGKLLCIAQAAIKKDEIDIQDVKQETRTLGDDSSEYDGTPGESETTCPCGWANKPKSRIMFGKQASPNEFPWMVALRAHFGGGYAACGGTIVTRRHVITAAHCVIDLDGDRRVVKPEDLDVITGAHNLRRFSPSQHYQETQAEQVYVRPEFPVLLTHDFAVIVVSKDLVFTKAVGPICMSPTSLNTPNTKLTIAGWGRTEIQGSSDVLLKAYTHIIDKKLCRTKPWEVCTRADQSATCSGDSGGPLSMIDPKTKKYTLVSAVSYGHVDCVSSPSVSTDVAYFYPWLLDIIKATYPKELPCVRK